MYLHIPESMQGEDDNVVEAYKLAVALYLNDLTQRVFAVSEATGEPAEEVASALVGLDILGLFA